MESFGSTLAVAMGGITILIAVAVLVLARKTQARMLRVLALFGCLVLPVLTLSAISGMTFEKSKKTDFCISCHSMEAYGHSLSAEDSEYIPAVHYQNNYVPRDKACYTCHTDYTWYGTFKGKMNGMKHLWVAYMGEVPEKIELYSPYQNRECLQCHDGAKKFEKKKAHRTDGVTLADLKSEKTSCLQSGCHDVIHEVDEFRDGPPVPEEEEEDEAASEEPSEEEGAAEPADQAAEPAEENAAEEDNAAQPAADEAPKPSDNPEVADPPSAVGAGEAPGQQGE